MGLLSDPLFILYCILPSWTPHLFSRASSPLHLATIQISSVHFPNVGVGTQYYDNQGCPGFPWRPGGWWLSMTSPRSLSGISLSMWDSEAISQLEIPDKTLAGRGNSGGRYCVSRELCIEDGGGMRYGCCRDAVLEIFVDGALFGAWQDVRNHQGYSELFVHSMLGFSGASGNSILSQELVRAKQLGSGAAADSREP